MDVMDVFVVGVCWCLVGVMMVSDRCDRGVWWVWRWSLMDVIVVPGEGGVLVYVR